MARASIKKESLPDVGVEEIEIFPYGEATMPRIGVLKFAKGTSKLELLILSSIKPLMTGSGLFF